MPNRPRNTFSRGAGLLLAFALNASPAAQTPEQLAETFDPEQRIALEGDRIQFLLPSGMQARILASTFEQVLDLEGRIRRPLSQVTTQLTFELSDGQQTSTPVTVSLAIPPRVPARPGANAKPAVVPALQEWQGAEGSFIPGPGIRLVITEKDANRGNPSLRQRMQVFAEDFTALTGLELPIVIADKANAGDIQIQL